MQFDIGDSIIVPVSVYVDACICMSMYKRVYKNSGKYIRNV